MGAQNETHGETSAAVPLPHVVIVGAGFGGLWAARALADAPVTVTLLDRENYHTFLPLLYQVGAAELEPFAIARPVRTILRGQDNLKFEIGEVTAIRPAERIVVSGADPIRYDYLVLAPGSEPFDFGVPGVRDHAFPLKTLTDGVALRTQVLSRFEEALRADGDPDRRRMLRFVIVGGGPTGVEYAGALAELIQGPVARDYPALVDLASIQLLEASPRLLGGLPEKLGSYTLRRLGRMSVEVRLEARVAAVWPDAVRLATGEEIRTETVCWTAGVRGPRMLEAAGFETERGGRVAVLSTLQAPGHPEVFVVGDAAASLPAGGEAPLPQLAQVAMQGGTHAAANIRRAIERRPLEPFRYHDKGIMAVIGRNSAVARIGGRNFTGWIAWMLWLAIHLFYLIGFRNRLAVMLNWAWDYVFFERAARILLPFRRIAPAWPPEGGTATASERSALPGSPDPERHSQVARPERVGVPLDVHE